MLGTSCARPSLVCHRPNSACLQLGVFTKASQPSTLWQDPELIIDATGVCQCRPMHDHRNVNWSMVTEFSLKSVDFGVEDTWANVLEIPAPP